MSDEIWKKIPNWTLAAAFAVLVVNIMVANILAVYAYFTNHTLVIAGLEFGSPSVRANSVIAYDLENCPGGWEKFEPAIGRFIIGAGTPSDPLYSTYEDGGQKLPISSYNWRKAEGVERYTLTEPEMPSHTHWNYVDDGYSHPEDEAKWTLGRSNSLQSKFGPIASPLSSNQVGNDAYTGARYHRIQQQPRGNNASHDNMPPYVALIYCKKMGSFATD